MTVQTLTPTARNAAPVVLSSIALVGSPLLLLTYFVLYPAYGETSAHGIYRAIAADTGTTQVADLCGLAGCFLAVPAALAVLQALRAHSPRLATTGAALAVTGWIAVAVTLMTDVAAVEVGRDETAFRALYDNPLVIALEATASLHIIGGVLLGVALVRTRVIARSLAVAEIAPPVVHLAANLGGQLWLDALTWVVTAAVGVEVARVLSRESGGGA